MNTMITPTLGKKIKLNKFDSLVETMIRLPERTPPTKEHIKQLARAWGNPGFSAGKQFLEHVALHACKTSGPVLECGSGLTTVLLGLFASRRGCSVTVLEHHEGWRHFVNAILERYELKNVTLLHRPLKSYGHYEWYDAQDNDLPYNIQLVVCDGPPGNNTKAGRYGLMPRTQAHLSTTCTVLLDDSHRKAEKRVIQAWGKKRQFTVKEYGKIFQFSELQCS